MYGLGMNEEVALRRLPLRLLNIVANELDDPESRTMIGTLLREDDPEKALVRQLVKESAEKAMSDAGVAGSGMGFKLKKAFKKFVSKVNPVVAKVLFRKKRGAQTVASAGAVPVTEAPEPTPSKYGEPEPSPPPPPTYGPVPSTPGGVVVTEKWEEGPQPRPEPPAEPAPAPPPVAPAAPAVVEKRGLPWWAYPAAAVLAVVAIKSAS